MLCCSAASSFAMGRIMKNPLYRKAASTVTLMLGLAMPALVAPAAMAAQHATHHRAATAQKTAAKPEAAPAKSKTVAAKRGRAHAQPAVEKAAPTPRARAGKGRTPAKREIARRGASAEKPSAADYAAAERVHTWEPAYRGRTGRDSGQSAWTEGDSSRLYQGQPAAAEQEHAANAGFTYAAAQAGAQRTWVARKECNAAATAAGSGCGQDAAGFARRDDRGAGGCRGTGFRDAGAGDGAAAV